MRPFHQTWLLLGFLVFGSVALAQEDPAGNSPTPAGDPAVQTDAALTDVESLLKLRDAEKEFDEAYTAAQHPDSTRIEPQFVPDAMPRVKKAAADLLAQLDRILASDKTPTVRKEQTKAKKLSFLYETIRFDKDTFGPALQQFIDELYLTARQEEGDDRRLSALLSAYRLKSEFIDSNKPADKIMDALSGFRSEFPRSMLGENLFLARAENLVEIGDVDGAIELYEKTKAEFPSDARMAVIDTIIARMKMVGQPAEVAGPTLDGGEFNIADYKGKVIVIDVWASWCGPCHDAFERLKVLHDKYQEKGLVIVGVNLDDKREDVENTLKRYPAPWNHLFFEPKENQGRSFENPVSTKLQVNYIPARYLVGNDGNFIGTDYRSMRKLEWAIVRALGLTEPLPDPAPAATPESEEEIEAPAEK